MKTVLSYGLGIVCALAFSVASANAKVWRVNNTAGVNADFLQISTAVSSALVQPGDTIYVEPSAITYNQFTLNKRLVIIGAGYLLSENTGLQYNNLASTFGQITIDSVASGSHIMGMAGSIIYVNSDVDNILIERSEFRLLPNNTRPNSRMSNWEVHLHKKFELCGLREVKIREDKEYFTVTIPLIKSGKYESVDH